MARGASCTCDPRQSSSAERRSASAFVLLKEVDEYSSGYNFANGARGGGARGGHVAVAAGSTVATTWRLHVVPAEAGPVRRARCGRVLAIWRTTRDRSLARIGRRQACAHRQGLRLMQRCRRRRWHPRWGRSHFRDLHGGRRRCRRRWRPGPPLRCWPWSLWLSRARRRRNRLLQPSPRSARTAARADSPTKAGLRSWSSGAGGVALLR